MSPFERLFFITGVLFVSFVCVALLIAAYVWVVDKWDKVMNYRKASDLMERVDDLQRQVLTKNEEIVRLNERLKAAEPDEEETRG